MEVATCDAPGSRARLDMNAHEALQRLAGAEVGRLATVDPAGRPHIVPITFAVDRGHIISVVDHKPKRTSSLQRLANIVANPRVSVLVDHYEADWSRLWWVRADGRARVVDGGDELQRCIRALSETYPQYEQNRPSGPAIIIDIDRVTGWSAANGV
jgi:PPOX class probable F420-dependent enzyme